MPFQHSHIRSTGFSVALLVALCSPCYAQESELQEITVTAQKRAQNIQDVGISITAFTGEEMKSLGLTNTKDLMTVTPGLNVSGYGVNNVTVFNIRGSAQNDFALHQEAPVAVYLDGYYLSSTNAVGGQWFDLDRVEVVRGPQGTLFGRNATGGVIQLITNKPSDEVSGFADIEGGQYGLKRIEAAFGGPIASTVSARLSVLKYQTDGYVRNDLGADAYDSDDYAARFQVLVKPNDNLSALLQARWSNSHDGPDGYYNRPTVINSQNQPAIASSYAEYSTFCQSTFFGATPGAPNQDCFGNRVFLNNIHQVSTPYPGYMHRHEDGFDATLKYNFGWATLVSISDYYRLGEGYSSDISTNPAVLFTNGSNIPSYRQISQELRLEGGTAKSNWVAGLYYLDINGQYEVNTISPNYLQSNTDNIYTLHTQSYAGYFQDEYAITPKVSVIAGARWTNDKKWIDMNATCTEFVAGICDLFYGGLLQNNTSYRDSRSENNWSGLLEVDWRPMTGLLLYAKESQGTKAGGYNGGAFLLITDDQKSFRAEILDSTEVGLKATWWNGKVLFDMSAFYYNYHDFQSYVQQGTSLTVFNTPAISKGAEAQITLNPLQGLKLAFGYSGLDAFQIAVPYRGVVADRPMANSAHETINGLARYEFPAFGVKWFAQLDSYYIGPHYWSGVNPPALRGPGYTVTDAQVGLKTQDDRWEFGLWVKNLADKNYFSLGFEDTTLWGTGGYVPGTPRWVGGTVRFKFK